MPFFWKNLKYLGQVRVAHNAVLVVEPRIMNASMMRTSSLITKLNITISFFYRMPAASFFFIACVILVENVIL